MALPCMNCGNEVSETAAKLFAAVFVCPDCFALAESFYKRSEKELKDLLMLQKESIRWALLQGNFRIGERRTKELTKTEIMQEVVRLHEMRGNRGK